MDKVEYDINNQVQKPEYDLSFILLWLIILFFIARGLYYLFMSRQEVYIVNPPTSTQSTTVVDPDSGEVPGTIVETQNDTTVDNNSTTTDVNNWDISGTAGLVL